MMLSLAQQQQRYMDQQLGAYSMPVQQASSVNQALRGRFARIEYNLSTMKQTVAFISHHKAQAGTQARYLHDKICSMLGVQSEKVFLDVNELERLDTVLTHVTSTGCMILIQTKDVLYRPYCLAELHQAVSSNIPIVTVHIQGGGYDFEEAERFLSSPYFASELEAHNPGSVKVLESLGLDVTLVGQRLRDQIPQILSKQLNTTGAADRVLDAMVLEIVEAVVSKLESTIPVYQAPVFMPQQGGVIMPDEEDLKRGKARLRRRRRAIAAIVVVGIIVIVVAVTLGVVLGTKPSLPSIPYVKLVISAPGSLFGNSIALSHNGRFLAVGAKGDGAAYVYGSSKTSVNASLAFALSTPVTVYPPPLAFTSQFGSAVAVDATGSYLLVGAPGVVEGVSTSGSAYVYTAQGGYSSSSGVLLSGGTVSGTARQGVSVALTNAGNLAFVGAPGSNTGAVFVFLNSGGTWGEVTPPITTTAGGTNFGITMAINSDASVLVIGGTDSTSNGAIYLFTMTTTNVWAQVDSVSVPLLTGATLSLALSTSQVFTISNGTVGQFSILGNVFTPQAAFTAGQYASCVASSSNGTAILIGAPSSVTDSGSFVLMRSQTGNSGLTVPSVKNEVNVSSESFGASVAMRSDGLLGFVGAPEENNNGAVYVLDFSELPL